MELSDPYRRLRRGWPIVLLMVPLGVGGAVAATSRATPQYQANTQLFVATQGVGNVDQLIQGNSLIQQRVQSYAQLVAIPRVLQPVIDELGLVESTGQLATSITAEAPVGTVLINVSVTRSSALEAQEIANAVSNRFGKVVAELETPRGQGAAPVTVSVVQPANLPSSPVSPGTNSRLAIGLILGLGLGLGLAALRELLDTSIKSESDVKDVADVPVLGGIAYDRDIPAHPLVVHSYSYSPRAEAFRQLRTNLQFVHAAKTPRSLVVTSSVPGEGKSTTAVNLAISLAAAGVSVVLVEGDLRRPKVAQLLGLEGAAGLTNVLIGQVELDDVLQQWGDGDLKVLACGPLPPNPSELLGSQVMSEVLRDLESRYEYVIIDAPPLLPVTDAAVISHVTEGAVIVAGRGKVNRDQLRRAIETLEAVDARVLGVVMNFLPAKSADAYGYYASEPTPDKATRQVVMPFNTRAD